jgi:hypothetical protein
MKCTLKKTFSFVLLLIFLYNISGYYLAFTVQQSDIKEKVQHIFKEKDTGDLLLLKISPEEEKNIAWNEKNEFSLHGKMYDVAFRKHQGNVLYLYCYNDSKEDHLFASMNSHVKNNMDNPVSGKTSNNTLKNPLPDYLPEDTKNEFSFFDFTLNIEINNSFSLLSFSIDKPSPPPRLA